MAHKFSFTVEVELERSAGKFASREEMAEEIIEALESADPGYLSGLGIAGDSDYDVTNWEVIEGGA